MLFSTNFAILIFLCAIIFIPTSGGYLYTGIELEIPQKLIFFLYIILILSVFFEVLRGKKYKIFLTDFDKPILIFVFLII